jgi:hypothetical protein
MDMFNTLLILLRHMIFISIDKSRLKNIIYTIKENRKYE